MVEVGQEAPDFSLRNQDDGAIALSSLRGRRVVLYGVSPDTVAKVKRFHDKQGLNFDLLVDPDHEVADLVLAALDA